MGFDVLDSLNGIFGNQVTRQVSAFFGDSEASTRAGLRASSTGLLAAIVQKSTTPGGVTEVFRAVTSDNVDPDLGSRLQGVLGNRNSLDPALANGEGLVTSLLGNRTGGVAHAVAEVAGIKPSSATGLMAMAAPMLLGLLKRQVTQGGLDARGFGSLLANQRSSLLKSGLDSRITSAMGFGSLQGMLGPATDQVQERARDTVTTADERIRETVTAADERPSYAKAPPVEPPRRSWIPWAIAALVLGALAFSFMTGRFGAGDRTPATAASFPAVVYFDSGQAAVDANDRKTIVAVVRAVQNTDAPLMVTGYTDSTGNTAQNMELAKNRAAAVRDALVAEGIPVTRVVMVPPAFVTEAGDSNESRRVEISVASAGTGVQR